MCKLSVTNDRKGKKNGCKALANYAILNKIPIFGGTEMKKLLIFLLTACLLAGCGGMSGSPAAKAAPSATEVAEAVTEIPTEAPPPIGMAVLHDSDTLFVSYTLTAMNPYGKYPEDTAINSQGADALARWLLGQDALDAAADYRTGLFLPAEDAPVYSGWISKASDNTKAIRLMTTVNVAQVGLLEAILPGFEEEYGYEVEIIAEKEEEVYLSAALGEADLILAPAPREGDVFGDNSNFRTISGFSEAHIPLLRCPYVLCGPADDPAGAAKADDMTAALNAIARAEAYFISRGDGSADCLAEKSLWQEAPEGDWYFAADTEMGPCLTIAEEMGGYVISDALTFEIFRALGGIIW